MEKEVILSESEIKKQFDYMSQVKTLIGTGKKVYIRTFGCQQNEADSEKLLGMAETMGYTPTDKSGQADLILVNTCAVREHAELKALSISGEYKHCKADNPQLIIGICGCMVSQEHRVKDIKNRYPYVDFLLGTTLIHRFPEILFKTLTEKKRNFWVSPETSVIAENLPVSRVPGAVEAWVSVMYGCNNFCTYCIVPYVRGRERSRNPEDVIKEVDSLIKNGVKSITLLGQNVNSYKPLSKPGYGFPELLEDLCKLDGECVIGFMTSHPKDATAELVEVIAKHPPATGKVGISRRFHLPLQSGSDRILKAMNRHYTLEKYMSLVENIKRRIPGVSLTTDIIVGFPTETEEEFRQTLDAVRRVRYDNIYSFIYSKRKGTAAAAMEGQIDERVKGERLRRLIDLQSEISKENNVRLENLTVRGLIEGVSKTSPEKMTARTADGKLIHFTGNLEDAGKCGLFLIEKAESHELFGSLVKTEDI